MKRTTALALISVLHVGCEASGGSSEHVRVAALDFVLQGQDVCLFSDDQTLRLSPASDDLDMTEPGSIHLADEVFVSLVETDRSCDARRAVPVERFDLEPSFDDETESRTVVLSAVEDELQAELLFEVEDAATSFRSCSAGASQVVRTSICSSSGTITTVTLQECQTVTFGMNPPSTMWVTTGSWTTSSGGGCDGGPGGPHEQ